MTNVISMATRLPIANVIPIHINEPRVPGDRDTAAARGRIAGRYCKHIAIANRQGFVEDIARISGVVMAKMGGDWYEARLIVPVSKDRPL